MIVHLAFSERDFVFREFGPSPHYWLSMGLPLLDIFGPPSAFIKTTLFLLPHVVFRMVERKVTQNRRREEE